MQSFHTPPLQVWFSGGLQEFISSKLSMAISWYRSSPAIPGALSRSSSAENYTSRQFRSYTHTVFALRMISPPYSHSKLSKRIFKAYRLFSLKSLSSFRTSLNSIALQLQCLAQESIPLPSRVLRALLSRPIPPFLPPLSHSSITPADVWMELAAEYLAEKKRVMTSG